jgi:hypothetical protein
MLKQLVKNNLQTKARFARVILVSSWLNSRLQAEKRNAVKQKISHQREALLQKKRAAHLAPKVVVSVMVAALRSPRASMMQVVLSLNESCDSFAIARRIIQGSDIDDKPAEIQFPFTFYDKVR